MGSTQQEADNLKRRIALIDADFIPYYVCHNKKENGVEAIPKTFEECKVFADDFVKNILKETKATHYAMCFTVGKCFRYKVNPQYKANRKYDDVIPFLHETKQYLIDTYKGVFEQHYLEADDIVVILKNRFPDESFIVSPDKDILMLDGRHFNPRLMEWITSTEGERLFWGSMIIGDSADNIKGIPKKGEKFVKKFFEPITTQMLPIAVYTQYLEHFGVERGVEEFYVNYKCLNIVKQDESVATPEFIEVPTEKEETLDEIN